MMEVGHLTDQRQAKAYPAMMLRAWTDVVALRDVLKERALHHVVYPDGPYE